MRNHAQSRLVALPEEPWRGQALKNMWWEDKDSKYGTLVHALKQAFNWSRSPEGYWYWYEVETELMQQLLDMPEEQLNDFLKSRKNRPV